MEIERISRVRYVYTIVIAVLVSAAVVAVAATLGRATLNLNAAITDKPDIGIYLLLPDEEISKVTVLREMEKERHYLVETKDGPKLVILKKGEKEWYVSLVEEMRE